MLNKIKIKNTIKPFNKVLEIEGDKSLSIRWALLASQAKGSNPIKIGTPAQYRKWFTKRKGKIVK